MHGGHPALLRRIRAAQGALALRGNRSRRSLRSEGGVRRLRQMVGISRAIHEIANQCMEEGKKRDDLMTEMAQVGKIMESEIGKECQ
jgi:hypothetical protein